MTAGRKARRGVGDSMRRARTLADQELIALEWTAAWEREIDQIIGAMEQAVRTQDHVRLVRSLGQMKEVFRKKMTALPGIIRALAAEGEQE